MDNVRKETHAVSVMNQPLETVAELRRKGQTSSPAPNSKVKTDGEGEKPSKETGNRDENSSDKRSTFPCRYRNCNNPSCIYWHPPVCQTSSLRLDVNSATSAVFDTLRQMRSPAKVKERCCERISCFIEGVYTIRLCVSRFPSEQIYST